MGYTYTWMIDFYGLHVGKDASLMDGTGDGCMMSIVSQVKVRKSHDGSHVGTNGIGIFTYMKTHRT